MLAETNTAVKKDLFSPSKGLSNVKDLFLITLGATSKIHVYSPLPCRFPHIHPRNYHVFFPWTQKTRLTVEKNFSFPGANQKTLQYLVFEILGSDHK